MEPPEGFEFAVMAARVRDEQAYDMLCITGTMDQIHILAIAYDQGRQSGIDDGPDECAYPSCEAEVAYRQGYQSANSSSS